ncbi:hypothetical protein L2E82_28592 [Cichorium intybus]|uniref:Uncharacterized protein n=1 Tax=Cichorium intybus TaxID=13427 RepID=A0ACB9CWD2_CICIN|nr:hypothetical protein L2E82_28592 [Cichorium intybus]
MLYHSNAWRSDGRCNELSVKAHALKGQHCVHGRLVVGDGFVTITRGESRKSFQKRKGTASNADSLFVSLALKLFEERVIVECKDIITLEKHFKLLEEEEEEEERNGALKKNEKSEDAQK